MGILGLQDKFADDLKIQYELEIEKLNSQLEEFKVQNKSIKEMMGQALGLTVNRDNHYTQASLDTKQQLIGSIYPRKIFMEENLF